jgi:hypothetical protein
MSNYKVYLSNQDYRNGILYSTLDEASCTEELNQGRIPPSAILVEANTLIGGRILFARNLAGFQPMQLAGSTVEPVQNAPTKPASVDQMIAPKRSTTATVLYVLGIIDLVAGIVASFIAEEWVWMIIGMNSLIACCVFAKIIELLNHSAHYAKIIASTR